MYPCVDVGVDGYRTIFCPAICSYLRYVVCLYRLWLTYLIFHRCSADDGSDKITMKFASGEIARRVCEELEKNGTTHLIKFLESSSEDSEFSHIRGQLFEEKMHIYIPGGGKFDKRKLDREKKTADDFTFGSVESRCYSQHHFEIKREYTDDLQVSYMVWFQWCHQTELLKLLQDVHVPFLPNTCVSYARNCHARTNFHSNMVDSCLKKKCTYIFLVEASLTRKKDSR